MPAEKIKIVNCVAVPNERQGRYETGEVFYYQKGWILVATTPTNEFGNFSEFASKDVYETSEAANLAEIFPMESLTNEMGEISEDDWTCISTRNEIPDYALYPDRPEFN